MSLLHFSRLSGNRIMNLFADIRMIYMMQREARKPQEQRKLLTSGLSWEEIMERLNNMEEL